jgi:hypothetical protein
MLTIDKGSQPPARFDPRDGDRFIVRPGTGRAIRVDVERK